MITSWKINRPGAGKSGDGSRAKGPGTVIFTGIFLIPFFFVGGFFLLEGAAQTLKGDGTEGWPMTGFALIFLTMASGFLALSVSVWRKSHRAKETPGETPWMRRPDWADARVSSRRGRGVAVTWTMAIIWNAISSPVLFVFQKEWERGNKPILIGLLFPLVGLGLLIAAVRATLRWKRFGNSELRLETLPARPGGVFRARLIVPGVVFPIRKFELRIACVRRTVTGSGKHRSTREELLWEERRVALRKVISVDKTGIQAPAFFRLPADLPESAEGNPAIVWRVEASAQVPGVDYSETFEVPVFNTPADPTTESLPDPLEGYQDALDPGVTPRIRGVRIRESAEGVNIHFRAARNPGAILTLTLITVIWSGIFVVLIKSDAPFIFPAVWAFFDALLLMALSASLFHSIRVECNAGAVTIRHRFIVPTITRRFSPGDLLQVKAIPGVRTGNTQYYRIQVTQKSGGKVGAGSGIRKKRDAVWIAERVAIAAGL